MTGELLEGDPYIGLWNYIIETAEHLYMLQDLMHSARIKQALGMNRHKGMGTSWRESNQNYVTIKQQIHSIETVTQING